ncbi:hypothetical protein HBB16_20785 [Pseudonocardia sp. MCCB 268]|nr:hypothetical protein [Pseudonocardia cytotoxica]
MSGLGIVVGSLLGGALADTWDGGGCSSSTSRSVCWCCSAAALRSPPAGTTGSWRSRRGPAPGGM